MSYPFVFHIGILILEPKRFSFFVLILNFCISITVLTLFMSTILLFYFIPLCHMYYIHFFVNVSMFLKMGVSTFLAPETGFKEDYFSTGSRGMIQDSSAWHLLCILFVLLSYQLNLSSSGILLFSHWFVSDSVVQWSKPFLSFTISPTPCPRYNTLMLL